MRSAGTREGACLGTKPHRWDSMGKLFPYIKARQRTPENDKGRQWTTEHDGTIFGTLARLLRNRHSFPKGAQEPPADGIRLMSNSEKIIRLRTVLARTGLSRSTLYRKMAEGTFPARVKISVHGAGWYESAIDRWIADPPGYRADNDNQRAGGEVGHARG